MTVVSIPTCGGDAPSSCISYVDSSRSWGVLGGTRASFDSGMIPGAPCRVGFVCLVGGLPDPGWRPAPSEGITFKFVGLPGVTTPHGPLHPKPDGGINGQFPNGPSGGSGGDHPNGSDPEGPSGYTPPDPLGPEDGIVPPTGLPVAAVPEPGTLATIGAALASLLWMRRGARRT